MVASNCTNSVNDKVQEPLSYTYFDALPKTLRDAINYAAMSWTTGDLLDAVRAGYPVDLLARVIHKGDIDEHKALAARGEIPLVPDFNFVISAVRSRKAPATALRAIAGRHGRIRPR